MPDYEHLSPSMKVVFKELDARILGDRPKGKCFDDARLPEARRLRLGMLAKTRSQSYEEQDRILLKTLKELGLEEELGLG